MLRLSAVSATPADAGAYLHAITDLEIVWVAGQGYLVSASGGIPGLSVFTLGEGTAPALSSQLALPGGATGQGALAGLSGVLSPQVLLSGTPLATAGSFTIEPGGGIGSGFLWDDPDGVIASASEVVAVATGLGTTVFAARADGGGVFGFSASETGGQVTIGPTLLHAPAARIAALQAVQHGGATYLLTADGDGNRLISYRVQPDGALLLVGEIGAAEGLGISQPTDITSVSLGGESFVLMTSAGSGALTVLGLGADGGLTVTDHVIDDRLTRFAGAQHVEALEARGRVFIFVAGNDDGISVLTLLPGGRLLHLTTFQDSAATTLQNVSALAADVFGSEVQLHVASAVEAGLTMFRFDLEGIGLTLTGADANDVLSGGTLDDIIFGGGGNDTLNGGAGADILYDGFGRDVLSGGAGADIFVFSADNTTDVILDFDPAVDRLDLSAFSMLYSVEALTIQTTAWGAFVSYLGEMIEIRSASGMGLTSSHFTNATILNLSRVPGMSLVSTPHFIGSVLADSFAGSEQNEVFDMLGGADEVQAFGGDDLIYGGAGFDTLDGGAGNDTLYGGDHADSLYGGGGNDVLWGDAGVDGLYGGAGNDVLNGGTENDWLWGGIGQDTIRGGAHNDRLWGEDGDDVLYGDGGFDRLEGGAGNDTLDGGHQADNLFGGDGDDLLLGGDGLDRLFGGAGNDTLDGGAGPNGLFGEAGDDVITAGAETDRVYGGTGNDWISTGAGIDTIYGGAGFDTINAGAGDDLIWGHANADTFIFADGFGQDRIMDFEATNPFERIDLAGVAAITDLADLLANHATQAGADVVIDDIAGNTITLVGVSLADLDASDFLF